MTEDEIMALTFEELRQAIRDYQFLLLQVSTCNEKQCGLCKYCIERVTTGRPKDGRHGKLFLVHDAGDDDDPGPLVGGG